MIVTGVGNRNYFGTNVATLGWDVVVVNLLGVDCSTENDGSGDERSLETHFREDIEELCLNGLWLTGCCVEIEC